jgi:hypothetical protein
MPEESVASASKTNILDLYRTRPETMNAPCHVSCHRRAFSIDLEVLIDGRDARSDPNRLANLVLWGDVSR